MQFPRNRNAPSSREEVGVPIETQGHMSGEAETCQASQDPSPGLQIQKTGQGRSLMSSVAERRFPDLLAACKLSTELKDAAYVSCHLCQVGLSPVR